MRSAIAVFLLLASVEAVSAQNVGVPDIGHAYAVAICAECHAVGPNGGESPNPAAPTFREVANTPGISEIALVVFFQTPHQTMPNLVVPTAEARDLIAYILSLKE